MAQKIDRYEILEEIGSGGFATVYRARDTRLDRLVAVKVMRPLLMSDEDFVKRFHREAKVAANLQHPNVVPVYDYGEDNGRLFIVMKLMSGSIAAELEKGIIGWEQAVEWITGAAAGLDFAHARHIIHRDIKPDNILLDELGQAIIADFGVVKALEKSTITISMSGGVLGTPAYMAPEVWNGETPIPATDTYALACVFYEMVTGEKLFDGPTPPAIMTLHFREPRLPEQWPDGVPPSVADILRQALAQDGSKRYASANLFTNNLTQLALDPFAEQYESLQSSMRGEKWVDVIALAEAILAQDAGYKDVTALLMQAINNKGEAEQALLVMQWREQAEEAIENEEWETAVAAAQQWLQLSPNDPLAQKIATRVQANIVLPILQTDAVSTMPQQSRLSIWVWIIGGFTLLALLIFGGNQLANKDIPMVATPTSILPVFTEITSTSIPLTEVIATNTIRSTNTPTNTPRPTNTIRPTNTSTNTPRPTNTIRPTNTSTNTPRPTNTLEPVSTATVILNLFEIIVKSGSCPNKIFYVNDNPTFITGRSTFNDHNPGGRVTVSAGFVPAGSYWLRMCDEDGSSGCTNPIAAVEINEETRPSMVFTYYFDTSAHSCD